MNTTQLACFMVEVGGIASASMTVLVPINLGGDHHGCQLSCDDSDPRFEIELGIAEDLCGDGRPHKGIPYMTLLD